MVLQYLNQFRKANNSLRKFRLCDNFERLGDMSLKTINITPLEQEVLMACPSDYGSLSYFLPWREDAGLFLDIPKNNPAALVFLTSELSGCFVSIQNLDNCYRIRHYNFQTENIDGDDFLRYVQAGNPIQWLVPDRGNVIQELNSRNIPIDVYKNYTYGDPAVLWGEYVNNDWEFYYQTPASLDNSIHRILVQ